MILISVVLMSVVVLVADGHSYVMVPPPRNAVDKDLPLFANGSFPLPNGKPGCTPTTSVCGCWCSNGTSPCEVAQTCLWFSQGCTIGCPTCDGENARSNKDLCGSGMQAKVCDPRARTYNRAAPCNTDADVFRYNPWRAPGSAPVFDPCGKAGGGTMLKPGPGAAFYTDTIYAKQGDLGSKVLKPAPSGTVWPRDSTVEVTWGLRANHGGGYQYRLCPVSKPLTEACMQDLPLPFTGVQMLQFANGSRQHIPGTYVYASNGSAVFGADLQKPFGPTWAMNPLPDHEQTGSSHALTFPPPCDDNTAPPTNGLCSGERPFHVSIIDAVRIPSDIPAGDYVLGFRWDAEETAQVWSTCADVTIA